MASRATATKITIKGKGTSSKSSGTVPCNLCRGTGRLKAGYNKKKK